MIRQNGPRMISRPGAESTGVWRVIQTIQGNNAVNDFLAPTAEAAAEEASKLSAKLPVIESRVRAIKLNASLAGLEGRLLHYYNHALVSQARRQTLLA